jgi:hypothetical protein
MPRGYGELPQPAKDALERSSAEFTAGRLAERAQHARQAAARAAGLPPAGGQPPAAGSTLAGAPLAAGPPPADGPAPAAPAGAEPWFADAAEDGRPAAERAGTPSGDSPAPGPGQAASNGAPVDGAAMATTQPVARWAWLSIAAMVVPAAVLLLVLLV